MRMPFASAGRMTSTCPVCEWPVPETYWEHPNGRLIACDVCGTYRIMERAEQRLTEWKVQGAFTLGRRTRLSAALRAAALGAPPGQVPRLEDPERLIAEYEPPADPIEAGDRILGYVRSRAPRGGEYVPLVVDRDYPVAGAETPAEFAYALSLLVDRGFLEHASVDDPNYRLMPSGWARVRALAPSSRDATGTHGIRRLFLSHAAADERLASLVRDEIVRLQPGITVFLASRPGDIRADEDWLAVIQRQLREADAYVVLLTPQSITRPWVWFETGAAWMSAKPWVLARAAGLMPHDVPLPLSVRQTYSLDAPAGAREVLRPLGITLDDPERFAAAVRALS